MCIAHHSVYSFKQIPSAVRALRLFGIQLKDDFLFVPSHNVEDRIKAKVEASPLPPPPPPPNFARMILISLGRIFSLDSGDIRKRASNFRNEFLLQFCFAGYSAKIIHLAFNTHPSPPCSHPSTPYKLKLPVNPPNIQSSTRNLAGALFIRIEHRFVSYCETDATRRPTKWSSCIYRVVRLKLAIVSLMSH